MHEQVRRDGAKEDKIEEQEDDIVLVVLILDLHVIKESMHLPFSTTPKAVEKENDIFVKEANDGKVRGQCEDVVEALQGNKAVCKEHLHDGDANEEVILHRQTLLAGEEGDALRHALVRNGRHVEEEEE